ncbi:MAG: type IX secretion system sortase PorU [Flavipsychrobacter sp.]|nr:type IX secretion system sortase PorU [Flavipsychrobacter sp.]
MKKKSIILSALLAAALSVSAGGKVTFPVAEKSIVNGYTIHKVWLQHYALPEVKLSGITYRDGVTIPAEAIPADPMKFEVIIGKDRKRPFAIIRVPAYSMDAVTGSPRRITEFSVDVTETATTATPPVNATALAKSTAASSVLASGDIYKISVPATGFYRVDYDFVSAQLGQSNISSDNIRVYGNGGNMLSENNADPRTDDLAENPIWVSDGGDGVFNPGDYFIFYATGPTAWKKDSANARFLHEVNIYEDKAFYFLSFDKGAGQRVQTQPTAGTPNVTVSDFDHYDLHEKDLVNPGTLGKEWWGEEFSSDIGKTLNHTINMDFGPLTGEAARFRIMFGARTELYIPNNFTVNVNGSAFTKNVSTGFGTPMASGILEFTKNVSGATPIAISYQTTLSSNKGFLNYIEVNARRQLNLAGQQQLLFRDWRSVGPGNVASYSLQGANGATQVWDVTEPLAPVRMQGSLNGEVFTFAQEASRLHEFAAFRNGELPAPSFVEKVTNQDLHSAGQVDYIIVTHPQFINEANELAEFHRQRSNMRVIVATTPQVYNEFSSGSQDISAIRDFARMFYQRAGNDTLQMPRYLLLFGDASYDYKDRIPGNTNFVPTFESREFAVSINSYCSDDFFSFLDDNENTENMTTVFNTMDIGVGRFPVASVQAAQAQVRKIKNYKSPASLGPWRLSTTMIADNADAAGDHMADAETMGGEILNNSNIFNLTKIYLDAVQRVSTPGGMRAPEANKAINDQIYKGTFLMNYSGHGNIQVLADERIIIQDDYSKWKNFDKLPIIITATCDYGQFDHPEYVSSGEAIMLKADGGAIASLTTTQLVYAAPNRIINRQFLEEQFAYKNGKNYSLGDAFRLAKNMTYATSTQSGELVNFRKFALLGDPALVPAFPEYNIQIDSVNDGFSGAATDTIKALGSYSASGRVVDDNNNLLSDFNGRVYITIYDKPKTVQALTDPNRKYRTQNNTIYKGRVNVTGGLFTFAFIAPRDINYDMGVCKMSLYAENGITDAAGADTGYVVGGFSDNPVIEDNPPVVMPYIGDSTFRDGGITGENTFLFAVLEDETGINVSGNTVGHDLTAILDGDVQNVYVLNDYYETEPNNYRRGYVYFPISGLSNGKHSLRIKAWDVNNNSGEGVVNFEVIDGNIVKINNLMNYPNPFSDKTRFVFEHNHPDEAMDVSINIYNTAGSLVRTIRQNFTPSGSRSTELSWDGTGNNGELLPSGLYVYRLNLATSTGAQESAYQKLVIVR